MKCLDGGVDSWWNMGAGSCRIAFVCFSVLRLCWKRSEAKETSWAAWLLLTAGCSPRLSFSPRAVAIPPNHECAFVLKKDSTLRWATWEEGGHTFVSMEGVTRCFSEQTPYDSPKKQKGLCGVWKRFTVCVQVCDDHLGLFKKLVVKIYQFQVPVNVNL